MGSPDATSVNHPPPEDDAISNVGKVDSYT